MAKTKIKPRQLAAIQDSFLEQREKVLQGKVNSLGATLFDKVYEHLQLNLLQSNGKILVDNKNTNVVQAIDNIFTDFRNNYNAPVIKGFVNDLQAITQNNSKYFKTLSQKNLELQTEYISKSIDSKLGLAEDGTPIKNGFVDKFIRDKSVLNTIKKTVTQSITKGDGIQELRKNLKTAIQGVDGQPLSGGLQQYYRNNAYDTFVKVDRLSSDMFAKDLGLRYFYWTGGIINTTRPICDVCNGMIIDSYDWNQVTDFSQLKDEYQVGMDENSDPSNDLGGYGCRHRKRYVLDSIALQNGSKILPVNNLLK